MTFSEARQKSRIELTPEEMREISQEINLKFAPNAASLIADDNLLAGDDNSSYSLRRPLKSLVKTSSKERWNSGSELFPKELYEIDREISRRFPLKDESIKPELFLLPVDPYHLYAYWNLGQSKGQARPQESSENDLILRIYWLPDDSNQMTRSNVWFDVPVHELNARQQVRLPLDDAAYVAALGKLKPNQDFEVYAYSNRIRVPRGRTKTMAVQRQDGNNVSDRIATAVPIAPKDAFPFPPRTDEEILVEPKLMDMILATQKSGRQSIGKGWYAQLHVLPPAERNRYSVGLSARFIDLLKEQGIQIQLIPEPIAGENTHFPRKNASGLGIRESI